MWDAIRSGRTLVADGASGTMLFARGLTPGACPESANLERPEWLEEMARLYLEAGADLLTTNTFGGSAVKLALYSLEGKVREVNAAAVEAVRRVARSETIVSGSCGPSGKILKPYGDAEPGELYDAFLPQMEALIASGVDVVCVETMIDLAEAMLAIRAAKSISSSTPVMATMTFDKTRRGFFTIMGVSIEKAVHGLEEAGADVVGSNCGNGIETMVEIAREFKRLSRLPVLIQPNAGLPELRNGSAVYPESPEFMADKAKALLDIGVEIIGGCCGTTPDHIRAFRRMVDSAFPPKTDR